MANHLLRAVLFAALCLFALVVAESREVDMESAGPTSRDIPMGDCAAHITECGVTDKVKIINKPASTIRVKIKTTTTAVVRLPDITSTITEVEVSTINDKIQGHCRHTTEYTNPEPAYVTEYETIEFIEEVVSIVNVTTKVVSIVHGNSVEKCFIKTDMFPVAAHNASSTEPPIADPSPTPAQSSSPPAAVVVNNGEAETDKEHVMRYHSGEHYAEQVAEEMSPDMHAHPFRQVEEPELEA